MADADSEIVPDTKDWTWVLERPCPECGHLSSRYGPAEAPDLIPQVVERLTWVLGRDGVAVRARPDRWSDLEYVCHVRDVFRRFDRRIEQMLGEDDPLFENWDQDATAVDDDYASQDPSVVAEELRAAAAAVTERIRSLGPGELGRPGRRSDGASFTIESLVRYMLHDPLHHVWDVGGDPLDAT